MTKKHLSRLSAPKNWPIKRKGIKWVVRPRSGPHPLQKCIPLNILLKNVLKYAKTTREVKKILNNGEVLVDKKIRKDHRFPVGLMDIIDIPRINKSFRLMLDKNSEYVLNPLKKEESILKYCKIINKKVLKKNKNQLNLYDGKNLLVNKNEYSVNDTVILDLEKKQIKEHLKFVKGSIIYLIDGKYTGNFAVLDDIKSFYGLSNDLIKFSLGKDKFETLKKYAFVVDKKLMLENEKGKSDEKDKD